MPKFQPQLIIFDCDGVLIDSEIISANTLIDLLKPLGLEINLTHIAENFLGRSFPTVAISIRKNFGIDLPDSFESDYRAELLSRFDTQLQPTHGIVDLLERLDLQFCVATSSSPQRVARSMEITGLNRFFSGHIYTASQVEHGKPAPDLFLHASKHEGVPATQCLVVEDSFPGIEAAHAARMQVLHYQGGSHFTGMLFKQPAQKFVAPAFDSWDKFFDMMPKSAKIGRA